jgi:hypothetical protein
MNRLSGALREQGHYPEAEKLERETLDIQRRVLGPEHPDTLASITQLAATLYYEGRYSEAEKLGQQALESKRRILGPENPDTLWSMVILAKLLMIRGSQRIMKMCRRGINHLRLFSRELPMILLAHNGS